MSPERWQHINDVFAATLRRPAPERPAFLAEVCDDDDELRAEVESLLSAHEEPDNFVDTPLAQIAADVVSDASLIGETLGHYRLESLLGRGGMGEVYLARDQKLGRPVALKLLPASFVRNEKRVRRFQQEARAASALSHPNIVTIYELGEAAGQHFIATEYIPGETLRTAGRARPMRLNHILEIAAQTAGALAAAHEAGVIHRDIKPENIMLRPDGIVKVLDFGLAKATDDGDARHAARLDVSTQTGVIMGTASYMSPEQARGQQVDARTDIFSLGIVLYEMLAGEPPFKGETSSHIIVAIIEKEPPPLGEQCPPAVREIVRRALSKAPADRYPTARAMLKALQAAQSLSTERNTDPEPGPAFQSAVTQFEHHPTAVATESLEHISSIAFFKAKLQRFRWLALAGALALLLGAFFLYRLWPERSIDSVAVLPFTYRDAASNAPPGPEQDYLADGVTENIIQSLSHAPALRVIARSSVFRYKGQNTAPQEAGQALKVSSVLTGHIVKRNQLLEISVELIDAKDSRLLWSSNYSTAENSLFTVQPRIANDIAARLQAGLTDAGKQQVAKQYTTNDEAYQLYLKGRYFWNKRTAEDLRRALELFQEAIQKDPNYALAYTGLADTYSLLPVYSADPAGPAIAKAREAARKALELDNQLAEAHTALASILHSYDFDRKEAEREYRLAIAANPNYATAHHWYASLLMQAGRPAEALAESDRAKSLDPTSISVNTSAGYLRYLNRDYEAATAQLSKTLELNPDALGTRLHLSDVYREQKNYERALAELQAVAQKRPDAADVTVQSRFVFLYAKTGKRAEALQIMVKFPPIGPGSELSHYALATMFAALGDDNQALDELEKSWRDREQPVQFIKVDPLLDSLRAQPRFNALLANFNLTP